jgi:predicted nucleic acid-binding protein
VVVADTSAMIALLDEDDPHHKSFRALYLDNRHVWLLPWAILPEVDYLAATRLGPGAQRKWFEDLVSRAYTVEWGRDADMAAARALAGKYSSLAMGLVDAMVMALAERLRADIATLDLRHFGAVTLKHFPRVLPRDLAPRARARR